MQPPGSHVFSYVYLQLPIISGVCLFSLPNMNDFILQAKNKSQLAIKDKKGKKEKSIAKANISKKKSIAKPRISIAKDKISKGKLRGRDYWISDEPTRLQCRIRCSDGTSFSFKYQAYGGRPLTIKAANAWIAAK